MSRLIIQGKAWGEFNEAKKRNGDIYISGYRTYGGTHTVIGVEQPTLNDKQKIVLDGLKFICANYKREFQVNIGIKYTLRDLYYYLNMTEYITDSNKKIWAMVESYNLLTDEKIAQVLQVFSQWVLEQEDE